MRIPSQTSSDTNGNTGKAFGFERTAEAFQLLSSTLYSNKPKAIIRELSCNALDAHTAAGKQDVPFEVKIPNSLDAQFHVKDFGPGLSHEDVLKLYTTYFRSTKQESNDFIGGFGVGSKSPFAYTDSFTVESRHVGKKRIYSAYLNDAGVPEMSMMMEVDSDEPSGLTVGFPVRSADFRAFETEATEVFDVFKVKPVVTGMVLYPKERGTVLIDTDNVTLRKNIGHHGGASIVVGAVEYPLRKYSDHVGKENSGWMNWLLDQNFTFRAPVGSVSVAVSREDLAYDDVTLGALPELLRGALKEMLTALAADSELSTEKVQTIAEIFDSLGHADKVKCFEMFSDIDLTPAKDRLVGLTAYKDLPLVQMVHIQMQSLYGMESVPRHRFGEVKQKFPLFDHASIHKHPRALEMHWQDMQRSTQRVTKHKLKCFVFDLPDASLASRMLAIDVLKNSKEVDLENNNVVMLIPTVTSSSSSVFTKHAKETLARWGVEAEDLTQQWNQARVDYHAGPNGLKKKGIPASVVTPANSGKAHHTANWCVAVDLANVSEHAFGALARRIKTSLEPAKSRKKSWTPLQGIHPRLTTEDVWYIEYDAANATFDGYKQSDMYSFIYSSLHDLNMGGRHIVIVPKGSEHIAKENWQPFVTAWETAYSEQSFLFQLNGDVAKLASLNQEICKQFKGQWSGLDAGKLLAQLPLLDDFANPGYYVKIAATALEAKTGNSIIKDPYKDLVATIESKYPLLSMLVEDGVNRTISLTQENITNLFEYCQGRDIQANSPNFTL